jgi:hypothetical protein
VLLEDQGLAVLRQGETWASLECGPWLGGHGHPDRLHLGLVAGGVPWLVDPGTGAYTTRDLFWYRSTLAHNAPRLDGASQQGGDAAVEAFESRDGWSWVRARWNDCTRTVIAGERLAADVLEFAADAPRLVELPWHLYGTVEILSPGRFEPATLPDEFATEVERFVAAAPGPVRVRASAAGRTLELVFDGGGELLRASVPGRPGATARATMLLRRESGRYVRFATALSLAGEPLGDCRFVPAEIAIAGAAAFRQTSEGWEVEQAGTRTPLRGLRRADLVPRLPLRFVTDVEGRVGVHATIPHLAEAPAVDGSLAGFPEEPTFVLDHEDQYRRSEEPFAGPEAFSARARLGWDEGALFVAVDVTKPDRCFRSAGAPPARLDNEPDDINSDGLQLFLQVPAGPLCGWLVVPDTGSRGVRVHAADGSAADAAAVTGAWVATDEGYRVTLALRPPGWPPPALGGDPAFDLMVNEMQPGRLRRAGQLTWSGGGGWVYLRGDRPSPERFGRLTLA